VIFFFPGSIFQVDCCCLVFCCGGHPQSFLKIPTCGHRHANFRLLLLKMCWVSLIKSMILTQVLSQIPTSGDRQSNSRCFLGRKLVLFSGFVVVVTQIFL